MIVIDDPKLPTDVNLWPVSIALSLPGALVETSVAHLAHLGIVECSTMESKGHYSNYIDTLPPEVGAAHQQISDRVQELMLSFLDARIERVDTFVTVRSVRLSRWGKGFADACDARAIWSELASNGRAAQP